MHTVLRIPHPHRDKIPDLGTEKETETEPTTQLGSRCSALGLLQIQIQSSLRSVSRRTGQNSNA